jgi:hypothetical protein
VAVRLIVSRAICARAEKRGVLISPSHKNAFHKHKPLTIQQHLLLKMNKQIIPYEAPITPRAPQPIMPGAVAVGGPNGGANPSEDEYTHDDDRTVQIGDEPANVSENDDTRVVDASTDTVVAKAITAEELREELREELQDEMEANIVHGEVVTRIWTKRRLWITGGVVLLVIIGIVIGVVFAITMSEPSDDGDCLSDTLDLYESNPSLQAAVNAYQTDILALFLYMDPSQCNATYCAMNSSK